jgi:hypothetical protein
VTSTVIDPPGAIMPVGSADTVVQPQPPLIDSTVTAPAPVLRTVNGTVFGCATDNSPSSSTSAVQRGAGDAAVSVACADAGLEAPAS